VNNEYFTITIMMVQRADIYSPFLIEDIAKWAYKQIAILKSITIAKSQFYSSKERL